MIMEDFTGALTSLLYSAFIILSLKQVIISADNFYCDNKAQVTIDNAVSGTIVTRQSGSSYYANGLTCEWLITTSTDQAFIHLDVTSSELQWAPIGAICVGYDYIQVFDGSSSKSPQILTWCGEENPHSISSSGSEILVRFVSNDRNKRDFAGSTIQFNIYEQSASLGQCPPGWHDNKQLTDGGLSCYSLKTVPETWTKAQEHCNYDNANLVSMETREEEKFIVGLIQNASDLGEFEEVWISLNDIEVDGTYRWMDGNKTTYFSWAYDNHKAEGYYNCILLNKDGKWTEGFCNENDIQSTVLHKYVCERNKVGKTPIYEIPSVRTDRGGKHTTSPEKTFIIIGCLLGLVVLFIIIAVAVVCTLKKRNGNNGTWRHSRANRDEDNHSSQPIRDNEEPRLPASAPPYTGSSQSVAGSQNSHQPTVVVIYPSSDPPPPYQENDPSTKTSVM